MKIRRSIVGQTNVCCNRYSDGTIFVGALTDFMHRSVKSRVAKSPRYVLPPPLTNEMVYDLYGPSPAEDRLVDGWFERWSLSGRQ